MPPFYIQEMLERLAVMIAQIDVCNVSKHEAPVSCKSSSFASSNNEKCWPLLEGMTAWVECAAKILNDFPQEGDECMGARNGQGKSHVMILFHIPWYDLHKPFQRAINELLNGSSLGFRSWQLELNGSQRIFCRKLTFSPVINFGKILQCYLNSQ